MESGWGLAMLGPRLFIFFRGRTAWFCVRKVSLQNFLFLHHSLDGEFVSLLGVWILILVPCTAHLNRSIFGLLAYFKRSLSGSVSLYISPVQGSLKVPFSGLSSLFVRSVTFFSTWVDAFPCSPCWGIGGRYLSLCNLKLKFNLSFDRSLWGCCQYLVADLILPWVVGISRTVNFGGLRLVFSGHISTVHLWGGTWVLIH